MRQERVKALKKAIRKELSIYEKEKPGKLAAPYKVQSYGNTYTVNVNHVHRMRRKLVRAQRIAKMVGAPKLVKDFRMFPRRHPEVIGQHFTEPTFKSK